MPCEHWKHIPCNQRFYNGSDHNDSNISKYKHIESDKGEIDEWPTSNNDKNERNNQSDKSWK